MIMGILMDLIQSNQSITKISTFRFLNIANCKPKVLIINRRGKKLRIIVNQRKGWAHYQNKFTNLIQLELKNRSKETKHTVIGRRLKKRKGQRVLIKNSQNQSKRK
jgi:hypothetical protein